MKLERGSLNLRRLSLAELESFFEEMGEPKYRGGQVFRRLHRHRSRDFDEFTELPRALRAKLRESTSLSGAVVEHRAIGGDGTEKFILDVSGEGASSPAVSQSVEAVWIVGPKRRTICVSCQSGCSLDCSFCATGALAFAGNLEPWQILEQVYVLEELRGETATNVVFMGMGEPFHNYDSVMAAAEVLSSADGAGLGARKITISTAGVLPGIERFTDEEQPFRLAVSLNHSDSAGRSEIMSINERYPLADLVEAARRYTATSGHRVTFEYVMIDGVNLDRGHLRKLIAIARSMPCKVNLIPLNTDLPGMRRPSREQAERFRCELAESGIAAFNRGSPGREVGAACGMLALDRLS